MSVTTDRNDPRLTHGPDKSPVPQAEVYLVLPEEERAEGFVRPYRDSYVHVGLRPKYALRDLTPEEQEQYKDYGYIKFEQYPEGSSHAIGRFWTQEQLDTEGCGEETRMGRALSETYARNPYFYGATYCCFCQMHLPVEQFVWSADGEVVGS